MNTKNKDIIITGFALFAMFFGAGNLIFPPYLGVITGDKFLIGFLGFIIADVGLSLLAILASAKSDGDTGRVFGRAGKLFAIILGSAIMICLGPLLAIPRTAATTFEMGIIPLIPGFNAVLFSTIFFAITLALTIKPSKVVDIIGSYLTPALLVCLLALIVIGIINPIGNLNDAAIENVFSEGILQGYQTLDALGAICLSAVLIKSLVQKGYKKEKDRVNILLKAGFIDVKNATEEIKPGQFVVIDGTKFKITALGDIAQRNLESLGHVTISFDGATAATLPGTINVEKADMPKLDIGTEISIVTE